MQKIKQISIKKYIMTGILGLLAVFTITMLVLVNVMADKVIEADIRTGLLNQLYAYGRDLVYEGNAIREEEETEAKEDGYCFLVITRDGEVCQGEYPGEFDAANITGMLPVKREIRPNELRVVHIAGDTYYLMDKMSTKLTRMMGRFVYLRVMIKKEKISSSYVILKRISYISTVVLLLLSCVFGYILAGKFLGPIRELCRLAENICGDEDLSKRINYNGRFREIAIVADANNRMLDKLEWNFQIQKRFNSDVAHELRNPLGVILAQCEYVGEHMDEPESVAEAMETIYRRAGQANEIVNQLLQLSRMEQKQIVLKRETVNLADVIFAVCEEEEDKAPHKVKFQFDIQKTEANLDVIFVTLLIQNLISNAIKYSGSNAVVTVSAKSAPEGVLIAVKDNGIGIPEEEKENIFRPFYRVDRSRNPEGNGLGLAIAMQIAYLHGGNITVESSPGNGSEFLVFLKET